MLWLKNKKIKFSLRTLKDIYSCPIEIIQELHDKGQFQYLTKLKGPQEGTYLYTTQFISLDKDRYFIIHYLITHWPT